MRGASVPRLAAGHAIVQGILATRRQAPRYVVHDRNDLPHNITAVAAGGTFEQIAHCGPDLRLGVGGRDRPALPEPPAETLTSGLPRLGKGPARGFDPGEVRRIRL